MADPVLHLGGSLARFTWEWRAESLNTWTLTVSDDGTAATIGGAVVLVLDDGQELAGEVDSGQVVWRVDPSTPISPPRGFVSASIVNRSEDNAGNVLADVWARGLVYTV